MENFIEPMALMTSANRLRETDYFVGQCEEYLSSVSNSQFPRSAEKLGAFAQMSAAIVQVRAAEDIRAQILAGEDLADLVEDLTFHHTISERSSPADALLDFRRLGEPDDCTTCQNLPASMRTPEHAKVCARCFFS